jgi:hypothetical protein
MKILHPSLWFVLFWLSLDCVAQQKLPIAYRAGDNPDRCSGSQLYELIAKFAKGEATKKDLQSELKWMADSCESAKGGGLKPKQIPTPKPTPTPAPTPTPPPNPDSGEAVGYKNNPPDIVVAHGAEHQLQPGQYLSLEGLADQYVIRHVCIHSKGEEPTRNDVVFNIPMPGLGSFQRSTVINYVPVIYSKANYLGASKNFWNLYWNWTECNYITCGKIVNPALKNGGKPFCNNHKWSGVGCANFKNYDKADFESDFAALVFGSEKVEVAKSSNSSPVKTNIPTDWFRDYPEPEKDSHEKNMQYLLLNIASYLARCPTLKYMTSANGSIGEPSMGKIVLYNSGTTDPFIVFIDNYSIIHNPVDSDFLTDDAIELLVKEGLNSGVPSGFLKECVDEFF